MSNSVYPGNIRGLNYTVMRTPEDLTYLQAADNGYTVRLPQRSMPIRHWTLGYEYIYGAFPSPNNLPANYPYAPWTDVEVLEGFYMQSYGSGQDFLFTDPGDNSVGPGLILTAPNPRALLQLWNDGAGNYYSPIQRLRYNFYEDVTDLNPTPSGAPPYTGHGTILVYANGVAQLVGPPGGGNTCGVYGPGLALPGNSCLGLYLKWYAEPTGPITATFSFYYRVAFETDTQDFEEFMYQLFTIGGAGSKNGSGMLKIMTSRPPSL